ncbi:hypothetical protein SAMN02745126_06568 [Enhydrobacter aerosaccus]|uniref:Uncharacterized protein n=1 Tax=Enhydrobacter aerosaccus TaxID=225324 RepID=A0A1T4TP36_9HYPH|nr:hypothetical protein [Enhydrobacter aerosaccus]SKA42068.1 hypothetical protein SAMN02745126_06568 [Enhydrobacter aerosaccus]
MLVEVYRPVRHNFSASMLLGDDPIDRPHEASVTLVKVLDTMAPAIVR